MSKIRMVAASGLLGLIVCAFLLAAGCDKNPASSDRSKQYSGSYPIQVVCTTGMVADIVENIGGPHVAAEVLIQGDPHLFKASASEIANLNRADAVFYSGLHLEGKMGETLERLEARKPTFAVTTGIAKGRLLSAGDEHYDPHVWFDVELWSLAAQHVGDTLANYDPAHADDYRTNTAAYRADLAKLHAECKEKLAEIPADRRALVTAHDAFSYFGRAYGLDVKAIQGISTENEAGLKEINELVEFIIQRKVKAVFVESTVPDSAIQSLIQGCKARKHDVHEGGKLYSDAMGKRGTPAGSYAGMVQHNVDTIVKALK